MSCMQNQDQEENRCCKSYGIECSDASECCDFRLNTQTTAVTCDSTSNTCCSPDGGYCSSSISPEDGAKFCCAGLQCDGYNERCCKGPGMDCTEDPDIGGSDCCSSSKCGSDSKCCVEAFGYCNSEQDCCAGEGLQCSSPSSSQPAKYVKLISHGASFTIIITTTGRCCLGAGDTPGAGNDWKCCSLHIHHDLGSCCSYDLDADCTEDHHCCSSGGEYLACGSDGTCCKEAGRRFNRNSFDLT